MITEWLGPTALVLAAFWVGFFVGSVEPCVPGVQRRCGPGASTGVQYCRRDWPRRGLGYGDCRELDHANQE